MGKLVYFSKEDFTPVQLNKSLKKHLIDTDGVMRERVANALVDYIYEEMRDSPSYESSHTFAIDWELAINSRSKGDFLEATASPLADWERELLGNYYEACNPSYSKTNNQIREEMGCVPVDDQSERRPNAYLNFSFPNIEPEAMDNLIGYISQLGLSFNMSVSEPVADDDDTELTHG